MNPTTSLLFVSCPKISHHYIPNYNSRCATQFQVVSVTLLLAVEQGYGMPASTARPSENKMDMKEKMEHSFNKTVEKVVETKMILLDVMGRSFNKTVDIVMGAKQHLKGAGEAAHQKVAETVNKTVDFYQDLKQDLVEYKRAKAMAKEAARHPPIPVVFVTPDFFDTPTINSPPVQAFSASKASETPVSALPYTPYGPPNPTY